MANAIQTPRKGGLPNPVVVMNDIGVDTSTNSIKTTYSDDGSIDAFGRRRVSNPFTLFDSQQLYNSQPLFWETTATGGGAATFLKNESTTQMSVAGATGDSCVRQTRQYIRYQPGKSQQILLTFLFGAAEENVRRRVGYFDAQNGIFFEDNAGTVSMVRRTYTSGAVVEERVNQANWNIDRLDGTGASGITLNDSKVQIFTIDLEWLGVGRARVGFVIDGMIYYVHQFNHANVITSVYMTTACLPLRYEITNTDDNDQTTSTMKHICASVASEGGLEDNFLIFGYTMTTARAVSTTPFPLLSIRVGTEFPSGSGTGYVNREIVKATDVSLFTEEHEIAYWFLYNGTLTNASWQNVNTTHSGVQYDVSATAIAGGVQVEGGGYLSATRQAKTSLSQAVNSTLPLTLNAAGTVGDILTVVCQRVSTASGDSDTVASLTWKELY